MRRREGVYSWVGMSGKPAGAPDGSAPDPVDVLAGIRQPDFDALRFRDPTVFVAGSLNYNAEAWQDVLAECHGAGQFVRGWLKHGVDFFDFFQHYRGEYRGRSFDSDIPPPMYFPNAPNCRQFVSFINETITKRLIEGSVELLGRVDQVPPPRCVNALSIEPTKPRLVLSMKGPNLWCKDTPFNLVPLGDIAKSIDRDGHVSGTDDV